MTTEPQKKQPTPAEQIAFLEQQSRLAQSMIRESKATIEGLSSRCQALAAERDEINFQAGVLVEKLKAAEEKVAFLEVTANKKAEPAVPAAPAADAEAAAAPVVVEDTPVIPATL